jgi:hypothetical protein
VIVEQEKELVESMLAGNETHVETSIGGVKFIAHRFGKEDFPNGSTVLNVTVEGNETSIGVPLELLGLFGDDLVLVFAVIKNDLPPFTDLGGNGEDRLLLETALDINIASAASGLFQNVSNLTALGNPWCSRSQCHAVPA